MYVRIYTYEFTQALYMYRDICMDASVFICVYTYIYIYIC